MMLMNNKEHALQDRFSVTLLLGAKDTLLPKGRTRVTRTPGVESSSCNASTTSPLQAIVVSSFSSSFVSMFTLVPYTVTTQCIV